MLKWYRLIACKLVIFPTVNLVSPSKGRLVWVVQNIDGYKVMIFIAFVPPGAHTLLVPLIDWNVTVRKCPCFCRWTADHCYMDSAVCWLPPWLQAWLPRVWQGDLWPHLQSQRLCRGEGSVPRDSRRLCAVNYSTISQNCCCNIRVNLLCRKFYHLKYLCVQVYVSIYIVLLAVTTAIHLVWSIGAHSEIHEEL